MRSPPHALQTQILSNTSWPKRVLAHFTDSLSSSKFQDLFIFIFFNLLRWRKLKPFQLPYCPQRQPPHLVFLLLDISPKPYWVLVL